MRQRAQKAGARVKDLTRELDAERRLRNTAIVECYEAHVPVATIVADAQVERSTVLGIVAET
jgi:hypothetical protein